jgi:hypothetical protein
MQMTALGTALRCPECGRFYETLTHLYDGGGRLYPLGFVQKAECGSCGGRWTIRGPLEISGENSHSDKFFSIEKQQLQSGKSE